MWLISPDAFVSVVMKGDNEDYPYCVRARDYRSLSHFCKTVGMDPEKDITHGGGTDYPFRTYASKAEVSAFQDACLDDVTYTNFKDEAHARRNKTYGDFLMDVWVAGLQLSPRKKDATRR